MPRADGAGAADRGSGAGEDVVTAGSSVQGDGATGGAVGDAAEGGGGAVFSVGDIDAITRFVARGLYRHFSLYRTCFEQEGRSCRESRQIQVETPLQLLPLEEAEPA